MATFLSLPPEIHYGIGEHCEKNCLISLCRTSKWLNQSYVPILYRHVNLRLEFMADREYLRSNYEGKRQMQFIHTLLNHPEYGSYIRSFKGLFCVFSRHESSGNHHIRNPDEGLWRAMKLLTHVQSVDVGSRSHYTDIMMRSNRLFPTGLFRSATSVTLRGSMPYKLAKSIIDAINPARLEYLCLDKVQECGLIKIHYLYRPGEKDENGRIVAYGATTGLLTSLTGKCTALRTLILRRIGQRIQGHGWHAPAEEASYKEWASFIRSVKGTLEKLTFQQAEGLFPVWRPTLTGESRPFCIMDERFRRHILPAIVSGDWPSLSVIELQGVKSSDGQAGNAALTMELRALLGGDTEIVVEEDAEYIDL